MGAVVGRRSMTEELVKRKVCHMIIGLYFFLDKVYVAVYPCGLTLTSRPYLVTVSTSTDRHEPHPCPQSPL
jgi:hypothetical protein